MPCVYAHFRKDNDAPFYVGAGKTSSRAHNFWHHSRTDQHKQIRKDYGAYASVIEDFEDQKIAYFWEQRWIKALRNNGYDLVNITDGGEGVPGLRMSDEAKAKMSSKKIGKTSPRKGVKLSEEQRARIAENVKNLWSNPEYRAHMSKVHKKKDKV